MGVSEEKYAVIVVVLFTVPLEGTQYENLYPESGIAVNVVPIKVNLFPLVTIDVPAGTVIDVPEVPSMVPLKDARTITVYLVIAGVTVTVAVALTPLTLVAVIVATPSLFALIVLVAVVSVGVVIFDTSVATSVFEEVQDMLLYVAFEGAIVTTIEPLVPASKV